MTAINTVEIGAVAWDARHEATGALHAITITDRLMLPDEDERGRDARQREHLLLDGLCYAARELLAGDGALLDDAAVAQALRPRTIADGLLVGDATALETARRLRDGLLVPDRRLTDLTRLLRDRLLFDDAVALETLRTRLVRDGVLLRDARFAELVRHLGDGLLLPDRLARTLERLFRDGLFLLDRATIDQGLVVLVRDGLLLDDARLSVHERRLAEGLLAADLAVRTLDRLLRDGLLLDDDAATEIEIGIAIILRAATDGLLLLDTDLRAIEARRDDGLLLGDASVRELARGLIDRLVWREAAAADATRNRLAADGLLLGDARGPAMRTLTVADRLLLGELATRMRALLLREGLLLRDTAATLLIGAIAEILVWARLRAEADPLGARLSAFDPLGVVYHRVEADPLGIALATVTWETPAP